MAPKMIDLTDYRRKRELFAAAATGTDEMIEESQRKQYTAKKKVAQRYAEALHGTLAGSWMNDIRHQIVEWIKTN